MRDRIRSKRITSFFIIFENLRDTVRIRYDEVSTYETPQNWRRTRSSDKEIDSHEIISLHRDVWRRWFPERNWETPRKKLLTRLVRISTARFCTIVRANIFQQSILRVLRNRREMTRHPYDSTISQIVDQSYLVWLMRWQSFDFTVRRWMNDIRDLELHRDIAYRDQSLKITPLSQTIFWSEHCDSKSFPKIHHRYPSFPWSQYGILARRFDSRSQKIHWRYCRHYTSRVMRHSMTRIYVTVSNWRVCHILGSIIDDFLETSDQAENHFWISSMTLYQRSFTYSARQLGFLKLALRSSRHRCFFSSYYVIRPCLSVFLSSRRTPILTSILSSEVLFVTIRYTHVVFMGILMHQIILARNIKNGCWLIRLT